MIRRFFCALMACLCLPFGTLAEAAPSAGMSNLIRLHVVAEDDSAAAQTLKRELRNVCLRCAEICIADAPDADRAYMRLNEHLDDFQAACADRARELGYAGSVAAETGVFAFPDRVYGRVLVPAGEYRALRVTIGAGEGHNWWCVLYPSLCALDESAQQTSLVLSWLRERIGG